MTAHAALIRVGHSEFSLPELLDAFLTHSEFPLGSSVECTLRNEKVVLGVVCALLSKFLKALAESCLARSAGGCSSCVEVSVYHAGILQSDCVLATRLVQDVASVSAAASWRTNLAFH